MMADSLQEAKQDVYEIDKDLYSKLAAVTAGARPKQRYVIPPYTAKAFQVRRGHSFRIVQEAGPQAAEMMLWSDGNSKEFLSALRSKFQEGSFFSVYGRLWSELPYFHPMATCIANTLTLREPSKYHHYHLLTDHCAGEVLEMLSGKPNLNSCHSNFLQAIKSFGLGEEDIHDSLNLFRKIRLDPSSLKLFDEATDSQPGDYVEMYAEMDLLVAVSVCPKGNNTRHWSIPGKDAMSQLSVEIHDTGTEPKRSPVWFDWRPLWRGKWEPGWEEKE